MMAGEETLEPECYWPIQKVLFIYTLINEVLDCCLTSHMKSDRKKVDTPKYAK